MRNSSRLYFLYIPSLETFLVLPHKKWLATLSTSVEYYACSREYWIELTFKNISDCNYDGGDCCGDDINISYCSDCTCNENPCEGMNE